MRFILVLLLATPFFVQAEVMNDYYNGSVAPGAVVYDEVASKFYLTLKLTTHLNSENDNTGLLEKTNEHAQFTQVHIKEVMVELETDGKIRKKLPIEVFAKVFWRARDNGPLGIDLDENQIVQGRLIADNDGSVQFEVANLPNKVMVGIKLANTFYPTLPVAFAFNGQIGTDDARIERDYRLWLSSLLGAIIPQALQANEVNILTRP